jgi:predicted P-loop ATPase
MTKTIDASTPIHEAAEIYHQLGLTPLRLYGLLSDGTCACRKPECASRNAGKHPQGKGWQKNIPRTLDDVREQFKGHGGNIGIYLGNQLVLIDADGPLGLEAVKKFGEMPETLEANSGSGSGAHWIYRLRPSQDPSRITDRKVVPGVDVKIRGQFVAAPSIHSSGNRYSWSRLVDPVPLPSHLYDLLCTPAPVTAPPSKSGVSAGSAKRMRAWVAKSEPAIAGQGGHAKTFSVACKIAVEVPDPEDQWDILCEYNQRCEPPWSEQELRHKLDDARKKGRSRPLEDRPRLHSVPTDTEEPPELPEDNHWIDQLDYAYDKDGNRHMIKSPGNVASILLNDPRWKGKVRFDSFAQKISINDPPWHDHCKPARLSKHWTDSDITRLQSWLLRTYFVNFSSAIVAEGAVMAAEAASHSSAEDWLAGLAWDGISRLDTWLSRYLGVTETPYSRLVGRWWLMSAAARVLQPGCKADHMLILYGDQGVGKSSAASILAGPERFSDTSIIIGSKDTYLSMAGKVIVEMSELEGLNKSEENAIKGFVASRIDRYRPPYARTTIDVPRQCVFIGTTNNYNMLRDDSGDRRFWPVVCGRIDRESLTRDREQLWAEAAVLYRQGHAWYPVTTEEHQCCEAVQQHHKVRNAWEEVIDSWSTKSGISRATAADIFHQALAMAPGSWKLAEQRALAGCLRRLGWVEKNDRKLTGEMKRYWERKDEEDGHSTVV